MAWDIVKSLLKGLQNLHGAQTSNSTTSFSKYFKCVVHRDIKLNNIGIKRNADGHVSWNSNNNFFKNWFQFYAVIADFGLSSVLLSEDTFVNFRQKSLSQKITDLISSYVNKLPTWLDWIRYMNPVNVDQEVLLILKQIEEVYNLLKLPYSTCKHSEFDFKFYRR